MGATHQRSTGYRAGTRDLFSKKFRTKGGNPGLTTYMRKYKVGDMVDVVANPAQQKGMPHKYYHGRTGRVWNITKRAIGVEVNKVHRQRQIVKCVAAADATGNAAAAAAAATPPPPKSWLPKPVRQRLPGVAAADGPCCKCLGAALIAASPRHIGSRC